MHKATAESRKSNEPHGALNVWMVCKCSAIMTWMGRARSFPEWNLKTIQRGENLIFRRKFRALFVQHQTLRYGQFLCWVWQWFTCKLPPVEAMIFGNVHEEPLNFMYNILALTWSQYSLRSVGLRRENVSECNDGIGVEDDRKSFCLLLNGIMVFVRSFDRTNVCQMEMCAVSSCSVQR